VGRPPRPFRAAVARELGRFRGRPRDLTGDQVVATFDGPAGRSLCRGNRRCRSCPRTDHPRRRSHRRVRDPRRAGRRGGGAPCGLGRRTGRAGEVLGVEHRQDLVAGAGLRFADRGRRPLVGAAGEWRLFAALPEAVGAVAGPPLPASGAAFTTALMRRERRSCAGCSGWSNRQIADALSIGERTVESHVANLLAKSGLGNRAQLAPPSPVPPPTPLRRAADGNHRSRISDRKSRTALRIGSVLPRMFAAGSRPRVATRAAAQGGGDVRGTTPPAPHLPRREPRRWFRTRTPLRCTSGTCSMRRPPRRSEALDPCLGPGTPRGRGERAPALQEASPRWS
jgi:DNA-binding CsgD family transcriptional regulator